MQKAIKYSKIIVWLGIIFNVIILSIIFILYNGYFEDIWVETALNILYPTAVIAGIMMYGGLVAKGIFEYKTGVRTTRRDIIIILIAVAVAIFYYVSKSLLLG